MVQIIIGLALIGVIFITLFILYQRRSKQEADVADYERVTMNKLLRLIKNEMAEAIKDSDLVMVSDMEYEAKMRNKRRAEEALAKSVFGIPSYRQFVIALIHDVLQRELPDRESCCEVIDFDDPMNLPSQVKWEILLMVLQKQHGKKVIRYIEDTYHITDKHVVNNGYSTKPMREFDYEMLDIIFDREVLQHVDEEGQYISYTGMLEVMSIMLFSSYHGFEVIDSLMQLDFDGLNFGSSGSIRYEIDGDYSMPYRTTNSVWLQIDAKWVLFSFLDFYTINKQRKVINQLVANGTTAPMTEKSPYKVCDGWDGSRRVAIRPPSGETWFFSCRKFTLSIYKMEALLNKPYVKNWELPAQLIYYLMKAEQTTAFTGQQNTGKTTMMKSAMEFVDDKNIRVLEMSFELALREIYKNKNVITVKPTDYVSSSQLQDLLKKTDGWVSLVGEVAEDIVAARMIQFCLIASAFTVFSHHGLDDWGLISGLSNSLVASGEYHDHQVAMSTVLDAIKNNVHLALTEKNERVVDYISQIVKVSELTPYQEVDELLKQARHTLSTEKNENTAADKLAEIMLAYVNLSRDYYTRRTDRVRFTSRKIIVLNRQSMTYEPCEWYTPEQFKEILKKLEPDDRDGFIRYYKENWRCSK